MRSKGNWGYREMQTARKAATACKTTSGKANKVFQEYSKRTGRKRRKETSSKFTFEVNRKKGNDGCGRTLWRVPMEDFKVMGEARTTSKELTSTQSS